MNFKHPIIMAETRSGKDFQISAKHLEGLNIIVGLKYMGKSHLAKSILLGLVENGAGCIVFDINDEYSALNLDRNGNIKEKYRDKIVALKPGENLKFPLRSLGKDVLINIMEALGLRDASLDDLSKAIEELGDNYTLDMIKDYIDRNLSRQTKPAIKRRIKRLEGTNIIDDEIDASNLEDIFMQMNDGRALIINLKGKSKITMRTIVQMIVSKVTDLLEKRELKPIFLFAEEAHMYIERTDIEDLVTRMRHLGAWQFYMTNTPTSLPELVVRQTDNLFCFHLSLPEDISHVAPASRMDGETLERIVKALPPRFFLAVGKVTEDYPLILRTRELDVATAGETRRLFKEP